MSSVDSVLNSASALVTMDFYAPLHPEAPGERTRVSFTLSAEDFSFVGREGESVVEPGSFRLQVEGLEETIELEGTRFSMDTVDAPPSTAAVSN
jgi:hypothetical protein